MAIDAINQISQHVLRHEHLDPEKNVNDFPLRPVEESELQEEIAAAMGDIAELVSEFGINSRSRGNGKGSSVEGKDFIDIILEESADKKVNEIVSVLAKVKMDSNALLQHLRSLFHNDSDLILALYELKRQRKLSMSQKKEIEKAISEHEKFSDTPKMLSGINVGKIAKKFSNVNCNLSASDLRSCYQDFLEMNLSSSYLYKEWIEQYGAYNRNRILAFMLRALVCDLKSQVCGFNADEFGPLSSKLIDIHNLKTFDELLFERKKNYNFLEEHNCDDDHLLEIFFIGLLQCHKFEKKFILFTKRFLFNLRVKNMIEFLQCLKSVYEEIPESYYSNKDDKEFFLQRLIVILSKLSKVEAMNDAMKIWIK